MAYHSLEPMILWDSTLAIGEWSPCRFGQGRAGAGRNWVMSGEEADIKKFLSLLCLCHQALICCYFAYTLVLRAMAKVEWD